MLNDNEKLLIIKKKLPERPIIDDLFSFCILKNPKRWKRNKRLNKKFKKHWMRYVSQKTINYFLSKIIITPLRRRLDYDSLARKAVAIEPLPQGALPYLHK